MGIGQKTMVLLNKNTKQATSLKLSIQISLSGLSFCVLNTDNNSITFIKTRHFDTRLNPLDLLEALKEEFKKEPLIDQSFEDICIIHDNDIAALVPLPLFDEDCLADYLKFNSKILKSDYLTYDELTVNDSVSVYVPYMNINNYIYDLHGEFTYKHLSTVLIHALIKIEKNSQTLKMYVNVHKTHFEIVVIEKSKLLFYNTFIYNSKEDFIYFILFTAEQLKLNPESLNLLFIGDITRDSELYQITYKYIRHVNFGERHDTYSYPFRPETAHAHFTLIQSL